MKTDRKSLMFDIAAGVILVIGELIYFWSILSAQNTMGLGPDAILINMLLEHWYEFFKGEASLTTLRSFWPAMNTLGYTDVLLVPGVIYSIIRAIGVDMLLASDPAFMIIHFIGIVILYKTLRELGCSQILSFVGLFFSLWSCSFTQLSYHTQFFCMAIVPLIFYSFIRWGRNRDRKMKDRMPWAVIMTLAVGMTFLSGFYIAYFTALIIGISLVLYIIMDPGKVLVGIRRFLRNNAFEVFIYMVIQLFWIIPFIYIYIPVYLQIGDYNIASTWIHAPEIYDILRTRSYAPVEDLISMNLPTYLPDSFNYLLANRIMETSYGWPILTFVLFVVAIIMLLIRKDKSTADKALISIGASFFIIYPLTCRYGENLPWYYVGKILPGAGTIRSLGRFAGIYTPFLSVFLCMWIKGGFQKLFNDKRKNEWLCLAVLGIILVFVNNSQRFFRTDIYEINDRLQQVAQPPEDCRAFFICPDSLEAESIYDVNMFAWLIADRFKCCTINGYSGNKPVDWELWRKDLREYYIGVQSWINLNGLQDSDGLYAYISSENAWIPYSELQITFEDS